MDNNKSVGFALHITLLMAFDGLKGIVERFGADHVNEGNCVYAVSDASGILKPVCIVGQFFSDLGILRALVAVYDEDTNGVTANPIFAADANNVMGATCNLGGLGNNDVRNRLRDNFGITFSEEAYFFLKTAQIAQDSRDPWGKAIEEAAALTMDNFDIDPPETRSAVQRLNDAFEADLI